LFIQGKQKLLEIKTRSSQVIAGELILDRDWVSALILQSRLTGIAIHRFKYEDVQATLTKISTTFDIHIGFCKMLHHDTIFFLPTHQFRFGVVSLQGITEALMDESSPVLLKEESTTGVIMFLKVILSTQGDEFILYGSEPGTVHIQDMIRNGDSGQQITFVPWNSYININDFAQPNSIAENSRKPEDDELVTPTCGVARFGKSDLAVIGTNTKNLYLLKLDSIEKKIIYDGRKSFLNKGVNCLSFHKDGKLLAVGGWDGVLRILSFPFMNPIVTYSYHRAPINSLIFLNQDEDPARKYTILCASDDGQLSCWNPGKNLRQSGTPIRELSH
jgi:WD40 repeat protein